jgi:hypothetical protein
MGVTKIVTAACSIKGDSMESEADINMIALESGQRALTTSDTKNSSMNIQI